MRSKADFIEGIVHQVILWTLQLALSSRRMGFFAAPFYGYRINPGSTLQNGSASAINHRTQSYLIVMQNLVATAKSQTTDAALRHALLLHANRECRHFLGLIRKRVHDPMARRDFAQDFFRFGLSRAMFQGAGNLHEFWRALRCWFVLRKYAASIGPTARPIRHP